ncbi:hypothetical protein Scep_023125 [Stephania cephalantha]|uniref:FAS1 domain-containing protein n=1 Tax=Stephania cephalantha TaxID=152367 RepID=A0AAP0EWV2_9MAGN
MESRLLIPLLLLLQLFAHSATTIVAASARPIPPNTNQSQPPQNMTTISDEQFKKVMEALVGPHPATGATLFIPANGNEPHNHITATMDPTVLAQHIVPSFQTFSDLLILPTYSSLPTLHSDRFIEITNNDESQPSDFAIEGRRITRPDLLITGSLAVHEIESEFDRHHPSGFFEGSSIVLNVSVGVDGEEIFVNVKTRYGRWPRIAFYVLWIALAFQVFRALLYWRGVRWSWRYMIDAVKEEIVSTSQGARLIFDTENRALRESKPLPSPPYASYRKY